MAEVIVAGVPTAWEHSTLEEICERGGGNIQTGPFGSQLHASDYVPIGVPSVMPQDIGDNVIRDDFIARITVEDSLRLSRYLLAAGDIVYSRRGDVERRALVRPEQEGWLCGTGCLRIRPGNGINSAYLSYYLGHSSVRQWIKQHAVGATMPNLNTKILGAVPVVAPPWREQESIAAALGALDDKIAVNERIAITYEQLLKLQVERMGLEVDPDPATAVPVTEFVHFNPKVPKPSSEAVYVDMAALSTNRAGISAWARREPKGGTRFVNGDTLLARITPCLENGKTGYIDFMEDGEIGAGSTEFIVMRSARGVPPEFTYFLARSNRFREHAIRNMAGSSGRQRVAAADAANFYIDCPDGKLLAEFGTVASDSFAHMRSLDRESRLLITLRDSLLPQLMSGKLRVRDAEKIVEDAV
ncbi:restriction endonuclease subunit S [Streptomyces sp. MK37H]|uniref:restriction endonuclease subunit S n=1 Tax=Streptomyces sp. MK37H TaxID=2699117 RepID=UPI001B35D539|nr:restriction endonuclease subunit S [Streptomyces sp. MK37H]MBP8532157.1 restriction endonuclease subunit S [Streptomyces sp. MK37H]